MSSFNQQFIYAISMIALGYIFKRLNIIQEKDGEGLSRIIFNITLPTLIIVSFNNMVIEASLFLLVLAGFAYGLMITGIGLFFFRQEDPKTKGMLTMLVAGFNIGLFAYPLIEGIWGKKGILYFGMFDVGNALIVFGVIYLVGSYYSTNPSDQNLKIIFKKLYRSIPLLTYIIVSILAIIQVKIPTFIIEISEIISAANMPLSFLLLGIYLSFSIDRVFLSQMMKVLLIRYGVGLVLGIGLFFILPFDTMFKSTLLLGFILPISVSVLPYSVEFNYDRKFVGTVSNLSILISFILLWAIANIIF